MSRRFYPKTKPAKPGAPRRSHPPWFIPALVVIGVLLGIVTFRLTYHFQPPRMSASRELPRRASTARDHEGEAPSLERTAIAAETEDSGQRTERSFEGLRVQVLNGCGVKGLARIITPALRAKGLDVRETRNARDFGYTTSEIIDRTGDVSLARLVAESLGVDPGRVTSEKSEDLADIDLTLIIGADYRTLHLDAENGMKE